MSEKFQEYCRNCDNDFYNGRENFGGSKVCWSLVDAKVVTCYKLHWWTAPTEYGAFQKVQTYDCHREAGKYAFQKKLPSFAVGVR